MMIKYKNILCLIVMVLCAACKPPQTRDVISKQHRQSYQCGLAMAGFEAVLSKDKEHLRLKLSDFELDSNEPQSPFLEFQDLMKNTEYLLFESTDHNNEQLHHTWQLLELKQEGATIKTQAIAKDILETQNLRIALVRIALHENNSQQPEGPSLSFAVYQQLRGQSQPSWCKVTAPVQIEQDGNAYQVQILKSAQAQVVANADHGHPGHSHQH
ncbi:hypothetical protein MRY82_03205 [bacterium]|nr:hypothetical protein [bacterium]